jgi:hypothetical protein
VARATVGGDEGIVGPDHGAGSFRVAEQAVRKDEGAGFGHTDLQFLERCKKTILMAEDGLSSVQASLRRHDPDQVMRVERATLLSACTTGSPFGLWQKKYKGVGNPCQVKKS